MAGITQAQAEAKLTLWMAADDAVANGQSYSIAGRTLTRANSAEIMKNITYWNNMVKTIGKGGLSVTGVTPLE